MTSQYQKLLRQAKAQVGATRLSLKDDRESDFALTTDLIGGIGDNLMTTINGRGRALTAQHRRQLQGIAAAAQRTNSGNQKTIRNARTTSTNTYGSVATGMAAPLYRNAEQHADAGTKTLRGMTRSGKVLGRGGQALIDIVKAGAAEAQAGAVAQTADALLYRAKDDARLVAEQQAMIMQSKLEFANWKRQQEYLAKQEEADPSLQGASMVAQTATGAAKTMRDYMAENPGSTVDELITAATEGDTQLSQDPNAMKMLRQLAMNVRSSTTASGMTAEGYTREDDLRAIMDTINTLYPDFKRAKVDKAVTAQLNALYAAARAGGGTTDQAASDGNVIPSDVVTRMAGEQGKTYEEVAMALRRRGYTIA